MENSLNLNEIHSELISDYLRFSKYQTAQRIKSIDYCFTTLLNCRVRTSETYTGDEVKTLLTDLQEVVRGDAETELNDAVHTNVLLVQNLLSQAEEWHLTLTANVNELENREKLAVIKLFDETSSNIQKINITVTQTKQVIPVEDMNVATALKNEITRLQSDNQILRAKMDSLELKMSNKAERDNSDYQNSELIEKLREDLVKAKIEMQKLQEQIISSELNENSHSELQTVQQAMKILNDELESSKADLVARESKLRQDLEARESKLRQVQSNLLLAEKELEKKFQTSSGFLNMKKILIQKNNKIKNLRKKLETLGGTDGGVDDEEEDDAEKVGFHV